MEGNTGELHQYSVSMLQPGVWMHCPLLLAIVPGLLPSNGCKIGSKLLAMKLVKISPLIQLSYISTSSIPFVDMIAIEDIRFPLMDNL